MSDTHHILVTGGAGFIGSHTVDHLLNSGHAVTVLDNLSTGRPENVAPHRDHPRFRFVVGDVTLPLPALADAPLGPVTRVLHLAAQVSVQRSLIDPLTDMHTNLGGTLQVLTWARANGVQRVVFASSAAVYGDVALPADEAAACWPVSPYGLHKLASEHHLRIAADRTTDSASCRFFNVYGPRQVPGSEYAGVIAIFLARARAGLDITVFGDGNGTRDFVYVGDVARALATVLFAPARLDGQVFNVGTGHETTIAELARAAAATGHATITHGLARVGDIERSVAAVERLHALGWAPEVGLADGLAATARWIASGA